MSTNGVNFDLTLLNQTQLTKFNKAKTEEEKQAIFKEAFQDKDLSKQEKLVLQQNQVFTEAEINALKKINGGESFLNDIVYKHLDTKPEGGTFGLTGAEKLGKDTARAEMIQFLIKDFKSLDDIDKAQFPKGTLEALGLTKEDLKAALTPKLQTAEGRLEATIPPTREQIAAGNANPEKIQVVKNENDSIALYRGEAMNGVGNEPTEVLAFDKAAGYNVRPPKEEGGTPTYFELKEIKNGDTVTSRQLVDVTSTVMERKQQINNLSDTQFTPEEYAEFADELNKIETDEQKLIFLQGKVKTKQDTTIREKMVEATNLGITLPENLGENYEAQLATINGLIEKQTTINKNKAAFTPPEGKNKIADVTLDEGDSGARLHVKKEGGVKTRIHLYKDSKTDETTGLPTHIAYSLGTNYGIKAPAEGQKREIWQDLFLGEDGKYHDRAKVRTFEAVVGDDNKVTLREVIDDKAAHDKKVKTFLDTQSKLHQAEAARHKSGVEAVGGTVDPAKVDAVPWFEQAGVRDAEMVEQLKAQVGEEAVAEITDLDKKTPAQQIEALQGKYIEQKGITVPAGATAESLATEIGKVNGELEKMHVPTGEQPIAQGTVNGNAIALNVANQRLERAKANDTLFDDGTEDSYKVRLAEELSDVIKDNVVASTEENPNPTYSADGLIQTITLKDNKYVDVYFDESGNITSIEHDVTKYTKAGIDYTDETHFDYTGKVYDAGYTGFDAIIDKVKALGVPLEPKNIDPAEVFSEQTTKFEDLKGQLEAQSVDTSGYTITEGRGNLNTNANTISNMQNMLDRATKANKLYADNEAAVDGAVNIINTLETIGLAEETVTNADGTETTQPKQPTKVKNADGEIVTTIELKGGQKVVVQCDETRVVTDVTVYSGSGQKINFNGYGVKVDSADRIERLGTAKDLPLDDAIVAQLKAMTLFQDFDFTTV